jgi:hypothetical protein
MTKQESQERFDAMLNKIIDKIKVKNFVDKGE